MGDPSIILVCLFFFMYPFASREWVLIGIASSWLLAGAAAEYFLLRRGKGLWVPALCAGAEAALEVLYQLERFRILQKGHDVWEFIFIGDAVLYILLGALAAWGLYRFRKRQAQ